VFCGLLIEETVADQKNSTINELNHRLDLWDELKKRGGPNGIAPGVLRELGIFGGAQGIWVDKARTGQVTENGDGITVAVLHTGTTYADDLSDECVIYHYPKTKRPPSRDAAEVNATKAAGRLGIPFFVITCPTPNSHVRDVKLGWVENWDDRTQTFLITFGQNPPPTDPIEKADEQPFELIEKQTTKKRESKARTGQQRFKFRVFLRYGPECAVCGLAVLDLLDAAHIRSKQSEGSDDPRNGLVLCANHHRAFDAGLYAIDPLSHTINYRSNGPSKETLGIAFESICHLNKYPHQDALTWYWEFWHENQT
jgi:putative restriction endonuclease